MLSLKGVPGIYFHNLTSTKNYLEGVLETGEKRAINRKKWDYNELEECIQGHKKESFCILNIYKKLLKKRENHPAFHPNGKQQVLEIKETLFSFVRSSPDESERVLVIANVSNETIEVDKEQLSSKGVSTERLSDILTENNVVKNGKIQFHPFQTRWLLLEE